MSTITRPAIFLDGWRELDASVLATAVIMGKGDLAAQARYELNRFKSAINVNGGPNPTELIGRYNQAARTFYLHGRADCARDLLTAALKLCRVEWTISGAPAWQGCMCGPYAFFGRLAALSGRTEDALHTYRSLYAFLTGDASIEISGMVITPDIMTALIESDPDFRTMRIGAIGVYLIESAKALLLNRRFNELVEFIDKTSTDMESALSSPRLRLAMAEMRGRALSGTGRQSEALQVYQEIRQVMPQGKPGFLAIYVHAARTATSCEGRGAGLEWLNEADAALTRCPDTNDLAIPRSCSQFAIAFERLALGDVEGAYRGAREALRSAKQTKHIIGRLRARVLLNIAARYCSPSVVDNESEHSIETCMDEIRGSLHGFERAVALLHLGCTYQQTGSYDSAYSQQCMDEAVGLLKWIESSGFCIPGGLPVGERPFPLSDPDLADMYHTLIGYAQQRNEETGWQFARANVRPEVRARFAEETNDVA